MSLIYGIDEAGRGPVIGPMVICCAGINEDKIEELKKLGVKDSKLLHPEQRKTLFKLLDGFLDYKKILIIDSKIIDNYVENDSLNELEAFFTSKLLNDLPEKSKVFIDCPDGNTNMYLNRIKKYLKKPQDLIIEHKADSKYLIVGAASIIAKVIRDQEIEKLKKKYNFDFGSGYPSDERTIKFLEYVSNNRIHVPEIRRSWSTAKKFDLDSKQKTLF